MAGETLASDRQRNVAMWSLAMDLLAEEASGHLDAAGIPSILLKGPALAGWLYPEGGRTYLDVDLLVPDRSFDGALAALAAIGFAPVLDDPIEQGNTPHAVQLTRAAGGGARSAGTLDLHRSFHGVGAPAREVFTLLEARCEGLQPGKRAVRIPDRASLAALVALHAAAHGPADPHKLSAREDLRRAIAAGDRVLWSEAYELARRLDATDFFLAGLRTDPRGAALLEDLGLSGRPLSRTAALRIEGPPPLGVGIEQLRAASGLVPKARVLLRKLFPTPRFLRKFYPLARRGRWGLLAVYVSRPLALLRRLPSAVHRYARASRGR